MVKALPRKNTPKRTRPPTPMTINRSHIAELITLREEQHCLFEKFRKSSVFRSHPESLVTLEACSTVLTSRIAILKSMEQIRNRESA